jgi:hypothetical protein
VSGVQKSLRPDLVVTLAIARIEAAGVDFGFR